MPYATYIIGSGALARLGLWALKLHIGDTLSGKKSRGKFSSGKNFVTSEKLVTFPPLTSQIRHFSPANF